MTFYNRRPMGKDVTRTLDEDTRYTVKAADFGFYDYDKGNTLAAVRIDTLPRAGALLLNGVAVSAGQVISRADIDAGKLVFAPAANASGNNYAAFTFSVQDNGGLFDDCPNNFCLNVCAVNDAPDARDDTGKTQAETAVTVNVKANDSDPDNTNAQLTVTKAVLLNPAQGTVNVNADGTVTFKPAAGFTGTADIEYTLKDPGGLTDTAKLSITVEPLAAKRCLEFDFNGCSPTWGTPGNVLTFRTSGVSVKASAFSQSDSTGVFAKAWLGAYEHGLGVTNGIEKCDDHRIDNAGGATDYVLLTFDQQVVMDKAFLAYVCGDSDAKVWIGNVDNAFNANLQLSGTLLGQMGFSEVSATNLTTDRWADVNGAEVKGNVIIIAADPGARKGTLGSSNLIKNGSFEEPVAGKTGPGFYDSVNGWTAAGDQIEIGRASSYGVSGATGAQVLELDANKAVGSVYQDVATTAGQTYQLSLDVAARWCTAGATNTVEVWWRGALVGRIDPTSTAFKNFTFQVTGSGGNDRLEFREQAGDSDSLGGIIDNVRLVTYAAPLADGCEDYFKLDKLKVCTVPADTAPEGADKTQTIAEDSSYVLTAADFGFTDPDAGQTLAAVRIVALPGNGTLTLNGAAVAAGQVVSVADINAGLLRMAPDANENGTPYAAFTFAVQDSAGLFDTTPNTFTLNVTPLNDAPEAKPDTGTTDEDTTLTVNAADGVILGAAGTDTDLDGDALSVTEVSIGATTVAADTALDGAWGRLTLAANGSYTYVPNAAAQALNAGQSQQDVFTYSVSDGNGGTASTTLTITVTGRSEGGPDIDIPDDNGANAGDNSIVEAAAPVTGSFTVSAPDGLASVTVGGTVLSAAQLAALAGTPVTINTGEGSLTLTGFDPATGTVSYRYSAPAQTSPTDVLDSIAVRVTDSAGNSADDTLDILILDTAPQANPDTNSVTEDAPAPATGNVISGTGADTLAADAAEVTAVSFGATAGTLGSPLAGAYGRLTLNADGSYSYALDNGNELVQALNVGQSLTEEFSYTLTDADGDASPTTLTITINGASDGGPDIDIPDNNGANAGDNSIVEAAAPITGSFTVSAPDGLASVTVGGTELSAAQLAALAGTPVTINTGEGSLTLTGFDPATGTVSYRYSAPAQTSPTDVLDSIAVRVTDTAGGTADDTLDILILDTAPQAQPDTNSVTEDAPAPATGNVITGTGADTLAADAAEVTAVAFGATAGTLGSPLAGTYGRLTLNADGSYSYALDNTNPAVQALNQGQTLTEAFSYTLTDADGDASPTTLTITINGASEGGPDIDIPDDNGANAGDNSIVEAAAPVTGTFSVSAPDGLASVTVGGTTLSAAQLAALAGTPVTINTGEGSLTLTGFDPATGTVSYRYSAPAQTSPTDVLDSIAVRVTDTAGGTADDTLDILILDTAPKANPDTNSVTEDAPAPATGNVVTGTGADTLAADAATVTAVSFGATAGTLGTPLAGTYGRLTLNADGSYSYALDNTNPAVQALNLGQSLTETFNYTLTDADGDASPTTLTITINGASEGGPDIDIPDDNGADAGDNSIVEGAAPVTGTFTVSAPDGLASVTVGGTVLTAAQLAALAGTPVTINTGEGSLTLTGFDPATGAVSYRYSAPAQTSPTDVLDSIAVRVTDTAGGTADDTLDILILDTFPEAVPDANVIEEDTAAPAEGNVITDGFGADVLGADEALVTGVRFGATAVAAGAVLQGAYGRVVVNANGSYRYLLDNTNADVQGLNVGEALQDEFTYTLTDADGDASDATLTITITGRNDGPTVTPLTQGALSEEGLPGGQPDTDGTPDTTNAATVSGSLGVNDADGDPVSVALSAPTTALTAGGVPVLWSGDGTALLIGSAGGVEVLRVSVANGAYSATLSKALDHTGLGEGTLSLDIGLTVSDGVASTTATLRLSVEDDSAVGLNVVQNVPKGSVQTNLLLVLDISGSMNELSGVIDPGTGEELTRLQLEKQAIERLFNEYDALGDVKVRLVTFSTRATEVGPLWVDLDTARTQLNALTAAGFTNYDFALDSARGAFVDAGRIENGQNVAYFLSDGDPTTSDGVNFDLNNPDLGIQPDEEAVWTGFLSANNITAYALGVGTDVTQVNLDPVAYDGVRNVNGDGLVVTDLAQLTDTLLATVTATTSGVLSQSTSRAASAFGADGGYVDFVSIEATTYTFDPSGAGSIVVDGVNRGSFDVATHKLSVAFANGANVVIDMDDGSYTYAAPPTPSGTDPQPGLDRVEFGLVDNDGDRDAGSLALARNGADLPGSLQADVFRWTLADAGSPGAAESDNVTGFDATGDDLLDLRDLLQGETNATLEQFLDFESNAAGTLIHVSSSGGFAGGVVSTAQQDLTIQLDVDLRSAYGLGGSASDSQVLDELLRRGKLVTDPGV